LRSAARWRSHRRCGWVVLSQRLDRDVNLAAADPDPRPQGRRPRSRRRGWRPGCGKHGLGLRCAPRAAICAATKLSAGLAAPRREQAEQAEPAPGRSGGVPNRRLRDKAFRTRRRPAFGQPSSARRPASVILTRLIVCPPALISRRVVGSPPLMRRTKVWRLKPKHGYFGGTERSAGKQLERQAPLCAEMTFSRRHRHLNSMNDAGFPARGILSLG
jgi:hypothetical protein